LLGRHVDPPEADDVEVGHLAAAASGRAVARWRARALRSGWLDAVPKLPPGRRVVNATNAASGGVGYSSGGNVSTR
jgi:hypothetical protein